MCFHFCSTDWASLSLTGSTAGVFTAFPLNSAGGEVDGWMDGRERERGRGGGGGGRGRRGGTDGRLVLPLVSFIPRLWSASVSPFGRGSSWRGEGWRDGGFDRFRRR